MKIAFVALIAALAFARATPTYDIFSDEYIRQINAKSGTWTAGRNFPRGTTIADVKRLLGTIRTPKRFFEVDNVKIHADQDVPESFDARDHWPNCTNMRQIRDQSACGSCWAVAATSAISDRICISSNSQEQVFISSEDLISCCADCGFGCDGGYPAGAWAQWVRVGLVSGGEYNSGEGCKPYPFPPCGDDSKSQEPCPDDGYPTPTCEKKCDTKDIDYEKDLHKGESAYKLDTNAKQIQTELMNHGPVEADFDVYSDFMSYKSGVYQRTEEALWMGGHAVKVIGWGKENNVPFWLVANSWNDDWGDKGMFKIIRGKNECDFEADVWAGQPQHR